MEFEALPRSLFGSRPHKARVADFKDPGLKAVLDTIKRALQAVG